MPDGCAKRLIKVKKSFYGAFTRNFSAGGSEVAGVYTGAQEPGCHMASKMALQTSV
jgi:hypothetical protein